MSGRGDNKKHGSAGRGANNQSNQGFASSNERQSKSDTIKSIRAASGLSLLQKRPTLMLNATNI
ncbi:MAG: hypothetical protein C4308_01925 [Chitinophagaceae bacterium]